MNMSSSNSFMNPTGTVEAHIAENGHFSIKGNGDLGGFYGAYRHQNLVQVMDQKQFRKVALTSGAVAALSIDGELYMWGTAYSGAPEHEPPCYEEYKPAFENVTDVCATSSAFAILINGQVIVQGNERYGGSMDSTTLNTLHGKTVSYISSTNYTFTARTSCGTVVTWGDVGEMVVEGLF